MTAAIFGTIVVVLAVLVIVIVSVTGSKTPAKGFGTKPVPTSVLSDITNVPASAFTAAGALADPTNGPFPSFTAIKPSQPALTLGGKPLIVYVGSDWCPYCAATRWPLVVALARFGTFKGLKITKSGLGAGSTQEIYPGTNTLSFYGSTYTSPYIAFKGVEQCSDVIPSTSSAAVQTCNGYEPLDTLGGTPLKVFAKYNFPPFETQANEGGIPFIDMDNKYSEDGAFINPGMLQGLTWQMIAQSLGSNPAALPALPIVVGANYYTAAICKLTHDKPGSVCNMPVIKQVAKLLKL
jgi:thiol-disulfide isomerase/thioredoxin